MPPPATLCFEDFVLDLAERRLTRAGVPIALGSRYFDALALLAGAGGALVTKDRFMAEVWRGVPVTDEALTQCVRTLRRALGDEAGAPRFIATVPKHGYRFLPRVTQAPAARVQAPSARPAALGGRIAAACAAGGVAAGALGGVAYGLAAALGGTAPMGMALAVLSVLGAALGLLGGAGVGLGLGLAGILWPGGRWLWPLGAALGGMTAGILGGTLGANGVALITGVPLAAVTGPGEGLMLGAGAGLGVLLDTRWGGWRGLLAAAGGGGVAGLLLTLAGGRLLGGSLLVLEQGMVGSQLGLVGTLGPAALWLAPLEGALFALVLAAACRRAM